MAQPLPLREQFKVLEHLQELDLKIDSVRKKKAELPALMKAAEEAFARIHQQITAKNTAISEVEKTQRQTQAAIDLNGDRLTRANSKLEGVSNSQEFQAANKEIEQLKKMNTGLDEQLKKSNDEIAAIQKQIADLGTQFEKAKGDRDTQASSISAETDTLDKQIHELMTERKRFTDQLDRPLLSQYDRVRSARAGVGFVPAVGGRCSGCNMMVPPQLYNELHKATNIHACPSCHRILFIPASTAPEAGNNLNT